jgi:hypothetical protein
MPAQRGSAADVLGQKVKSILFDQNSTQHRMKTLENTPLVALGCQSRSRSSVMYIVGYLAKDQLPFRTCSYRDLRGYNYVIKQTAYIKIKFKRF